METPGRAVRARAVVRGRRVGRLQAGTARGVRIVGATVLQDTQKKSICNYYVRFNSIQSAQWQTVINYSIHIPRLTGAARVNLPTSIRIIRNGLKKKINYVQTWS